MSEQKQAHIFFSGNVQGVGFRFTTRSFANELGLKGWVKNLPDGRVEIVAEGTEEDLEQLCRMLEEQFEGYIREKDIDYGKAKDKFGDFGIAM